MASRSRAVESGKNYIAAAASVAATVMLASTAINECLPDEFRGVISSGIRKLLFRGVSTEHVIFIGQTSKSRNNELYDAIKTYLRGKIPPTVKRLRASKNESDNNNIIITLDDGEELADTFEGVQYRWRFFNQQEKSDTPYSDTRIDVRWYELKFHAEFKESTLNSYFPHILERSKEMKAAERQIKLYMNEYGSWSSIDLHHPATMETLALEADLKRTIVEDLARFVKRKEYYNKIGKAWKRGYLLFGPPGTGKSSLIAAMANYLRFDIYDLDLKAIHRNSDLKRLLIKMKNKSMLVMEDIDCSIDVRNRDDEDNEAESDNEVTLSGLLNIIDGLWSSSGEERIVVLTTNFRDRLDPGIAESRANGYADPDGILWF